MQRLEDYMNQYDLSEDDVINMLTCADGCFQKNLFYVELAGDTAYIETKGDKKMTITDCNLEKGYIRLRAIK